MISVVLPTYNGEKYIGQAIESVIAQTYTNWELIIVDDCSSDSTTDIIKHYAEKDPRISIIRNTENLRLPGSLNRGFKYSHGEYLTWTSDDNCYKSDALQIMISILAENKKAGMAFSGMQYIDSEGKNIKNWVPPEIDIAQLKYKNIIGASFLYKRNVYIEIGDYDTSKFLVEDYDYWLRVSRSYDIIYIPYILYQYRLHKNSLTESKNFDMLRAKIGLLEESLNKDKIDFQIQCKMYREIATACLSTGLHEKMCYYLDELKKLSFKEYNELAFKLKLARHMSARQIKCLRNLYMKFKL